MHTTHRKINQYWLSTIVSSVCLHTPLPYLLYPPAMSIGFSVRGTDCLITIWFSWISNLCVYYWLNLKLSLNAEKTDYVVCFWVKAQLTSHITQVVLCWLSNQHSSAVTWFLTGSFTHRAIAIGHTQKQQAPPVEKKQQHDTSYSEGRGLTQIFSTTQEGKCPPPKKKKPSQECCL